MLQWKPVLKLLKFLVLPNVLEFHSLKHCSYQTSFLCSHFLMRNVNGLLSSTVFFSLSSRTISGLLGSEYLKEISKNRIVLYPSPLWPGLDTFWQVARMETLWYPPINIDIASQLIRSGLSGKYKFQAHEKTSPLGLCLRIVSVENNWQFGVRQFVVCLATGKTSDFVLRVNYSELCPRTAQYFNRGRVPFIKLDLLSHLVSSGSTTVSRCRIVHCLDLARCWQVLFTNVSDTVIASLDKFWPLARVDALVFRTLNSTLCYITSR